MKTTKTHLLTAGLLLFVGGLAGCAASQAPHELLDARMAYHDAQRGPAAQANPAELHVAKQALDRAERSFADHGADAQTKDLSYVAMRKAQLAEAAARATFASRAKVAAELEAQRYDAESLRSARTNLESSQQNLAKTQEQLDSEKKAREEAEKKAEGAMLALQKIASVKQETRGMVITLSGAVLFATNEATLLPAAVVKLNEVADALIKGNPDANIVVEGHTDSQGQRPHNMDLALRRAEAVKAQLVSRGVASDRIKTIGMGPDRPIADNKSPEGRANNRRVEIVVEPSTRTGPTNQ